MVVPPQHDRRQHPRTRVSWPVVVEAGTNRHLSNSVDISSHGAKVRIKTRLKTGTGVRLEIVPPEGPPLRVAALVWRVDADGLVFLFARDIHHQAIRGSMTAS
jgi:PilZ domain-containing protein